MTDDAAMHQPEEPVEGDLRSGVPQGARRDPRRRSPGSAPTSPRAIPRATEILLTQDLEGAEYMILADDALRRRLARARGTVLLRARPPGTGRSDLRQIVAALRIIAEIERSADLAANLCKAARRIYGHTLDPKLRGIIQKMGDQATKLFKEATESYMAMDANRAAALDDMDQYLDGLQREFVQVDLREPLAVGHRAAGRRAARRRRPLLRTHRRPRREHRRAHPLRRHRMGARRRRRPPLRHPPGRERPGVR